MQLCANHVTVCDSVMIQSVSMSTQVSHYKTPSFVRRHEANPVLTSAQVPYPSSLVFNAGVLKREDRYVMVFRNDYKPHGQPELKGTNLGLAFSDDGINWTVEAEPCWSLNDSEIRRAYDPRLTVIDGEILMCFAVDTAHGVRGGIARTTDFRDFEVVSMSVPDNRNMVLFPEKIDGMYVRLERPFPVYSRGGQELFDVWISRSPDLVYWGDAELVLGVEHVPFANNKIGPAAPPIRTSEGWLTLFHAVHVDPSRGKNGWEDSWTKWYAAGVMLLDLENPAIVKGMSREPILVPEASYETSGGYRNDVIFPTGVTIEPSVDGGDVLRMYYGAADTVMCVAEAGIQELVGLCTTPVQGS